MKRILLAFALTIPTYTASASGIPVADIPAFAQRLAEFTANVERWREQLQTAAEIASTVDKTYDSLTKVTNLHDVVNNDFLREFIGDDYLSIYNDTVTLGLGGIFEGDLDLSQAAIIRDACKLVKSAQVKSNCVTRQKHSYKLQYSASMIHKNAVERAKQIEKLATKLETMEDPKQVLDLQARIATEAAAIENENVRAQALMMAHAASEDMLAQQQTQMASEMWDITEGVQLTPISFGD